MPESSPQNKKSTDGQNFTNWLEVLSFLFRTKRGLLFTGSLIIVLLIVVGGAVSIVVYVMRPNKIEVATGVGTVTIRSGNTQNAAFLLSPAGGNENTPWVRTGIQIEKDDRIKITASGRVHTSLRRLVAQTQVPEVGEVGQWFWVGPEGLELSKDYPFLSALNPAKLLPDKDNAHYGYGMLLAAVEDKKRQVPQDKIVPIGENSEFTAETTGELLLTINDIWLDYSKEKYYLLEKNDIFYQNEAHFQAILEGEDFNSWSKEIKLKKTEEQYQRRLKNWKIIVKNKRWNAWYADNVGAFSVSITVN